MLSRRHFRIKVMQALYAFYLTGEDRLDVAEKQLKRSFDKLHELYIYQLSLLVELADMGRLRMEEAKKKFFPTEDELNPNTRFVDNPVIQWIANHPDYQTYINRYKINWADDQEMIRKLWVTFKDTPEYLNYIQQPTTGLEQEKEVIRDLIRNYLVDSDILRFFFEERNILWTDDYDTALLLVMKTIKGIKPDVDSSLLSLIQDDEIDEMKDFILPLFRKTILHGDKYEAIIAKHAENWEFDRIAIVDVLLMKMAICELIHFPSIPIKVTINEYIEISKEYSTTKSKVFINGMLDKIVEILKSENQLRKSGRGLLES